MRPDGRDIKYAATSGTLPIRSEDDKVAARMFFVAYTRDGEDVKTRPVPFLYRPYHFVDNDNSLIDVIDLVFIDAISTGYSRTVPGVSSAQFHGQQGDLPVSGDFINEYLKTCGRWPSRKFLFGKSYERFDLPASPGSCRPDTASG
jgi:carboxypeptidase C (cathepsin A)